MDLSTVDTALNAVAKVYKEIRFAQSFYDDRSLADLSKLTRVEPLTIVSKDLLTYEDLPAVNQSVLSLFCAHYLQAMNIIAGVQSADVVKKLDQLNPNRDELGFVLGETLSQESALSLENYRYSMPRAGVALEADKNKGVDLHDLVNLSVGRQLAVEISVPGNPETGKKDKTVSMKVDVRLMVSSVPNDSIVRIMAHQTEETTLTERYHAWRSGRIRFIQDLIFAQDLIDEYKKSMVEDDTRTMETILGRVANSKKYGVLSRNPSLASASNIFVMSETVAKSLESKLGGKLSNQSIRKKAFENTYAMLLVVVDRDWNRVSFYTRGVAESTDVSIKELQASAKGKGPDIMDIMKSFNMGAPASF